MIFLGLSFLSILLLSTQVKASVGTVNVRADCSGAQAYYHYTYSRPSNGATWQYNVSNTSGMNLTFNASTSGSGNGASSAGITWTVKLLRNGGVDSQGSATAPNCSTPPPDGAVCGNSVCEAGESYSNCPGDCPDTSPPSVSITSPTNNSTVSGTVTLSANAADPQSGISQVRFLVQSIATGSSTTICTDTSYPYSCSWDTTSYADGGYRVYAEATNRVGLTWNRYISVSVANVGPVCTCTAWVGQGCKGAGCALTELRFTRTCTPSGCDTTSKCVADVTCGACTDQCSSGQKDCPDSTHYRTCGQYDTDTCLDWSSSEACSTGQTCPGGVCSGVCTVPNDCSPSGKKECLTEGGTTYKTCGNYDADCGLEWSPSQLCSFGQKCSGGVCGTTPTVPAPKISLIYPSCMGTTSRANIYWTGGDGSQGFWVDIDNDNNWGNGFWNKNVTQRSTFAPDGFVPVFGATGSLVLNGGSSYYIRVYDSKIDRHSSVSSFTAKTCGSSTSTKKILNDVPLYNQHDYPDEFFAKDPGTRARVPAFKMSCEINPHTISKYGCAPTSVAMILDYYKKNMGVVNAANLLTDNNCIDIFNPCQNSPRPYSVYGSAIPKPFDPNMKDKPCSGFFESMGINLEGLLNRETLFNDIARHIDLDDPVFLGIQSGTSGHAVVAKGYRKDAIGDAYIIYANDPAGGERELHKTDLPNILAAYAYVN